MKGIVFDIKEFALHDGGGIRTTVFMKGCPLRCIWCHNPEGLSPKRELYLKQNGCLHCGLCLKPCTHPECRGLGRCLHICPKNLVCAAGEEWDSSELAEKLLQHRDFYNTMGGGITLSGGEPLAQADFCTELLCKLRGQVHRSIETSGYAHADVFRQVIDECDFVIMDLKLADSDKHREFTGVTNEMILANAGYLQDDDKRLIQALKQDTAHKEDDDHYQSNQPILCTLTLIPRIVVFNTSEADRELGVELIRDTLDVL